MDIDDLSREGQLWMWIHPSAFEQAKETVQEAITKANRTGSVQAVDLENSLVMFDFTGPRSTALLQAVLKPCTSDAAIPYEQAHKVSILYWDPNPILYQYKTC
jgi:ribonuclease P/MRP protein subunit POP1